MHNFRNLHAADALRKAGIANPFRLAKIIKESIAFLRLDLSGLTVLTEAASGPYVVTPIIASLAGASHVLALTRDSQYASARAVIDQTRALEALCDTPIEASIYTQRSTELFAQADVVTNLGFVRPIDSCAIAAMKPDAVIPLMCEAWELRSGDVDLKACNSKEIKVGGTNEDYPGLDIFSYSAWLCLKMLFDAQVEVHQCKISIVGADKFGRTIYGLFSQMGIDVKLLEHLRGPEVLEILADLDALVIADYTRTDVIIGEDGDIEPSVFSRYFPALSIIHFAGVIDAQKLFEMGVTIYPYNTLESHRMGLTLGALSPIPVIKLHTAGLKVAELLIHEGSADYQLFCKLLDPVFGPSG